MEHPMFNTTKALLSVIVIMVLTVIVLATWVFTPPHSGVAISIGMIALPFAGVFISWIYDEPRHG